MQAQLSLEALKLAVDVLKPGGVFVSKVFRGSDYNAFLFACNELFDKVGWLGGKSNSATLLVVMYVCALAGTQSEV